MATTYLVLSNRVLRELNEVELTSTTFSSSRGIQTAVKDFINKAVHDIYNEGTGWTTGDGSPSYTSSGNGRLNLNSAAAYQSISTVVNKTYKIQVRVFSPNSSATTLIVRVGTSAGGTQNLNTTIGVTNYGEGNILDTTFTATATTSYVYVEASSVQLDVDYIRVSRSDITPSKVAAITYDTYLQTNKVADDVNNSSAYGKPIKVIRKPDYSSFILSPIPGEGEYTLSYDYFTTHTDLSAHGDTMGLPDRFSSLIIDRAKYYVYMLRSDPEHAQLADRDYQRKLKLLKVDYGTHSADYMRTDTIAESISTNVGTRIVSG